jgi:uncharacterized membrane protein
MAKRRAKAARDTSSSEAKRGKGRGRPAVLKKRSLPNWPVLLLALLGMALTAYLSATSWLKTAPAYCTEGSGCDLVQNSRWGTFLGLPTATWGFLAYAALGHIAFRVRDAERHWKFGWTISLAGLAISLYLTAVSLFVLHATCFYCLTSLGLMGALFVVVALQHPQVLPRFSWPAWAGQTALLAVALVVGLHLHYGGVFNATAGPEDPYLKGLAEHLSSTGAVFYGAFW